jgi:hypothetical protein
MSAGTNVTISVQVQGDYTAVAGLANEDANLNLQAAIAFLTGAGVNQADTVYTAPIALGPSGTETLDLNTGLTDALGQAVAMVRCKTILIISSPSNPVGASITRAGGASNPFLGNLGGTTPTDTVNPGGMSLAVAPDATAWAVASGTANIKLTNNSSTAGATGTLVILGSAE